MRELLDRYIARPIFCLITLGALAGCGEKVDEDIENISLFGRKIYGEGEVVDYESDGRSAIEGIVLAEPFYILEEAGTSGRVWFLANIENHGEKTVEVYSGSRRMDGASHHFVPELILPLLYGKDSVAVGTKFKINNVGPQELSHQIIDTPVLDIIVDTDTN